MNNLPGMSKKQAEFFAILILICTVTAAAILVIDFQIKGAILEESNKMRRAIEGWQRGQRTTTANGSRSDGNDRYNPAYPSDMVDSGTTGMEETGTIPGSNGTAPAPKPGRPKRPGSSRPGSIPGTGE